MGNFHFIMLILLWPYSPSFNDAGRLCLSSTGHQSGIAVSPEGGTIVLLMGWGRRDDCSAAREQCHVHMISNDTHNPATVKYSQLDVNKPLVGLLPAHPDICSLLSALKSHYCCCPRTHFGAQWKVWPLYWHKSRTTAPTNGVKGDMGSELMTFPSPACTTALFKCGRPVLTQVTTKSRAVLYK